MSPLLASLTLSVCFCLFLADRGAAQPERVDTGLVALYQMRTTDTLSTNIPNLAPESTRAFGNLTVHLGNGVNWASGGVGLTFSDVNYAGGTRVTSTGDSSNLLAESADNVSYTVEVWFRHTSGSGGVVAVREPGSPNYLMQLNHGSSNALSWRAKGVTVDGLPPQANDTYGAGTDATRIDTDASYIPDQISPPDDIISFAVSVDGTLSEVTPVATPSCVYCQFPRAFNRKGQLGGTGDQTLEQWGQYFNFGPTNIMNNVDWLGNQNSACMGILNGGELNGNASGIFPHTGDASSPRTFDPVNITSDLVLELGHTDLSASGTWQGVVYQVAVYARAVTPSYQNTLIGEADPSDARTNFLAALFSSADAAESTHTLVEDGGPQLITLTATNFEDEALIFTVTQVPAPAVGQVGNFSSPTTTSVGAFTQTSRTITFEPAPDFVGNGTFIFEAATQDGSVTDTAVVTIIVENTNDAPTGSNGAATGVAQTDIVLNLTGATDVDSTNLTWVIAQLPANGGKLYTVSGSSRGTEVTTLNTAINTEDQQLVFVSSPPTSSSPTSSDTDTFMFRVSDFAADSLENYTYTITYSQNLFVSDASYQAVEDTPFSIPVSDLTTEIGEGFNFSIILGTPSQGNVAGTTYTPELHFSGEVTLPFVVDRNDVVDYNLTGTITINVTEVNDIPTLVCGSGLCSETDEMNPTLPQKSFILNFTDVEDGDYDVTYNVSNTEGETDGVSVNGVGYVGPVTAVNTYSRGDFPVVLSFTVGTSNYGVITVVVSVTDPGGVTVTEQIQVTANCDNGFGTTSGTICQICNIGTVKSSADNVQCTSCNVVAANGSTTAGTGSIDVTACGCAAGEEIVGGACTACAQGSYKAGINIQNCTLCPDGENTTATGSTSDTACVAPTIDSPSEGDDDVILGLNLAVTVVVGAFLMGALIACCFLFCFINKKRMKNKFDLGDEADFTGLGSSSAQGDDMIALTPSASTEMVGQGGSPAPPLPPPPM